MKRIFAAVLVAAACVVGSTPGFAVGGVVHLLARGEAEHGLDSGMMRNPTTRFGAAPPTSLPFENRITAPLAAPVAAPTRSEISIVRTPVRRALRRSSPVALVEAFSATVIPPRPRCRAPAQPGVT